MNPHIINQVKANKKYKTITDSIVKNAIKEHFKNKIPDKATKQDIKDIRKNLHRIYSSYQTTKKSKRDKLLVEMEQLVKGKSVISNTLGIDISSKEFLDLTNKILKTNRSTSERIKDYNEIYKQIFKVTGKPKTIVDIGSGLNPLSFPHTQLKKVKYYSFDIDTEDINFLNRYFSITKKLGLVGKAQILDINSSLSKIPKSDIIFLWKIHDLIPKKNKEKIILKLIKKTKYILVSFATKTLSGKQMKLRERTGFELFLARNNLLWNKFSTYNELFYVVHG